MHATHTVSTPIKWVALSYWLLVASCSHSATQSPDASQDADVLDLDADTDEEQEIEPDAICASFPIPYPRDAERATSQQCLDQCGGDIQCLTICEDSNHIFSCYGHTYAVCSWPVCRVDYRELDCCMKHHCDASAMNPPEDMSCILEHCESLLDNFIQCAESQGCEELALDNCFQDVQSISEESPYRECVDHGDYFPARSNGDIAMTWSEYIECVDRCGNDRSCIYECDGGETTVDCVTDEELFCGAFTLCGEVYDEYFCCALENCPSALLDCIRTHCASYAQNFLSCIPDSCQDASIIRCTSPG